MKYKIESKNTTNFVELHDCQCSQLLYENSKITLEMEWMEILSSHPENPYDKAHQSDIGLIEFNNIILIDCEIEGNNLTESIESKKSFLTDDILITSYFEDSRISSNYKLAELDGFLSENRFLKLEFLFKDSMVMWNDLNGESWFEEKKWNYPKEEYTIKEILKMMSWCNSEKIQKQGLKLASNIKYLDHFFQPVIDNESKNLWENCAIVLSERTDEELTPWLIQCFAWMQDMNWPGASIILDRLHKFADTENLSREKNKAIKIARILKDNEWLKALYQIK